MIHNFFIDRINPCQSCLQWRWCYPFTVFYHSHFAKKLEHILYSVSVLSILRILHRVEHSLLFVVFAFVCFEWQFYRMCQVDSHLIGAFGILIGECLMRKIFICLLCLNGTWVSRNEKKTQIRNYWFKCESKEPVFFY